MRSEEKIIKLITLIQILFFDSNMDFYTLSKTIISIFMREFFCIKVYVAILKNGGYGLLQYFVIWISWKIISDT